MHTFERLARWFALWLEGKLDAHWTALLFSELTEHPEHAQKLLTKQSG